MTVRLMDRAWRRCQRYFTGLVEPWLPSRLSPPENPITAPLADIASKNPQAIFFGGYVAEAVVIVNEMKRPAWTT